MTVNYDSAISIKNVLAENGLSIQKKFGQNFLLNPAMRKKITDALHIEQGKTRIAEIGPGLGAMTQAILDREPGAVTVFEIDAGYCKILRTLFADALAAQKLELVQGDVLKTFFEQQQNPDILFGNLPYNIAATFIAQTITSGMIFKRIVVTVQKEIALRITGKPKTKNYSALSLIVQKFYTAETLCDIGAANFYPKPNVDSRTLILTARETAPNTDAKVFAALVHKAFAVRRKMLRSAIDASLIAECGFPPTVRAEELSVADFERLCYAYTHGNDANQH
ncbi:MAG: 16S rRNA (adenine(1518)-N(6)/adenine(1519)-N(6)) -dimethyltransferase RsmA [Treponemataceae bacterium]|nr:MAG: 16S rRNA (adenine(1518)-N(6)/adenine(1519)-N(6)) -dimethyltransferase RsmA [Treponemataceae bacterium]